MQKRGSLEEAQLLGKMESKIKLPAARWMDSVTVAMGAPAED